MLGWSISLFRVRGIQLAVHFSFLLLLAYVAWEGWAEGARTNEALSGLLVNAGSLLVFFTCVVLHELGHCFTAQRFGVRVPRILLLPIGGMAEFDSIPRAPRSEILIALAGPAVNFAIVGLLLAFVPWPHWSTLADSALSVTSALQLIVVMNLVMGCFNLVPVFPMDGGRVLRAILSQRMPYLRATYWAASLGKILSIIFGYVAVRYGHNPLGGALFAFIFIAGEIEYRAILRQERESQRWDRMIARLNAEAIREAQGSSFKVQN